MLSGIDGVRVDCQRVLKSMHALSWMLMFNHNVPMSYIVLISRLRDKVVLAEGIA